MAGRSTHDFVDPSPPDRLDPGSNKPCGLGEPRFNTAVPLNRPIRVEERVADMKILLAEDESALREYLSELLTRWGAVVTEARSASEALRLTQLNTYDVALLDLRLGDHDALWLIDRAALPAATAIVVMSGFAPIRVVRQLELRGVTTLLAKPFSPDELFATLERKTAHAAHVFAPLAMPCTG
jgi:CheY-like chemotaxis protein